MVLFLKHHLSLSRTFFLGGRFPFGGESLTRSFCSVLFSIAFCEVETLGTTHCLFSTPFRCTPILCARCGDILNISCLLFWMRFVGNLFDNIRDGVNILRFMLFGLILHYNALVLSARKHSLISMNKCMLSSTK